MVSITVDPANKTQTLTLKAREWVTQPDGRKLSRQTPIEEITIPVQQNVDGSYPTPGRAAMDLVKNSPRFGPNFTVEWVGRGYWVQCR